MLVVSVDGREPSMCTCKANIVYSGLSGTVTKAGVTVEVVIYRQERDLHWALEVIDAAGTTSVWDEAFPTDAAAYAEFERTVADEGIRAFVSVTNVLPFRLR